MKQNYVTHLGCPGNLQYPSPIPMHARHCRKSLFLPSIEKEDHEEAPRKENNGYVVLK
jgi:hypothetical protein